MKAGRVILAIVFFILFVICFYFVVSGWRTHTYESVFPEDANVVIQLLQPMDVPLKVLNSSVAKKFFETKTGKVMLAKINTALAAGGGGDRKQPKIYKEVEEGVTVFHVVPPPKNEEEKAEKKAEGHKLDLEQLKKGMSVGGAVIKGIYVAAYGNPAKLMESPEPQWLVTLDIGRSAKMAGGVVSGRAVSLSKKPEDEKPVLAFAFLRNLVILGDPQDVKRAIHVAHGTMMKAKITKTDDNGNEVAEEVKLNTKPLGESKVWKKAKAAWKSKTPDFRLTLLVPNILAHFMSDEATKAMMCETVEKFGLDKLIALVYSTETGTSGLKIRTTVLSDPGNPLIKIIDQPESEMKWPDLLPDGYMAGAGMTAKNYVDLFNDTSELFGESSPTADLATSLKKIFGVEDEKLLLKYLTGEINLIVFATNSESHTVYCINTTPGMHNWMEQTENTVAREEISAAEKMIETAVGGGAESFAAELLTLAQEALEGSRNALEDANSVEAVVLARKANELAETALKTLYNQADNILNKKGFMYAWEQQSKAQEQLDAADKAYSAGNAQEGTKLSQKALEMARCAWALEVVMKLLEEAKSAGADSKAASTFTAAGAALSQAKSSWNSGNYSSASTQAQLAASLARQALSQATGSPAPAPEPVMTAPEQPDTTLPEIESPRVVHSAEVYSTVGTKPLDYTFLDDDTMCLASSSNLEAFLGTPRGNAFKNNKMRKLFENIPIKIQGLVVADIYALLKNNGVTASLDEEVGTFVEGLNLLAGVNLETKPTEVAIATVLPVKLFDGHTGGGTRSTTVLVIWVLKLLLYVFTILFLYLTVKLLSPKKAE